MKRTKTQKSIASSGGSCLQDGSSPVQMHFQWLSVRLDNVAATTGIREMRCRSTANLCCVPSGSSVVKLAGAHRAVERYPHPEFAISPGEASWKSKTRA